MKQLVETNIYSKALEAERSTGIQINKTVERWGREIHWSTHRCVNRNHGQWTVLGGRDKGKEHKWNAEL